ncbi:executer 1 [Stylosanthes scabra]|uniref:Executer 1 n=1 Tax=Stylosanthes scabra TaxID=79078 RepID=A0ABU6TYF5_9FABA|nr:executer 1 [Stylosanthes scabra]
MRLQFYLNCVEQGLRRHRIEEDHRVVLVFQLKIQSSSPRVRAGHAAINLAKYIGKGKVPSKVLKEVGDLINLTLSQAQNHQPLSGTTTFNRIEIPASLDPLNGLYVGAHGTFLLWSYST